MVYETSMQMKHKFKQQETLLQDKLYHKIKLFVYTQLESNVLEDCFTERKTSRRDNYIIQRQSRLGCFVFEIRYFVLEILQISIH